MRTIYEVQTVNRETGQEGMVRVEASSPEAAREMVVASGEIAGAVRLVEIVRDPDEARRQPHNTDAKKGSPSALKRGCVTGILILGCLTIGAIALAVFGYQSMARNANIAREETNVSLAKIHADSLVITMELYILDNGLPPSGASLDILWQRPSGAEGRRWREPYVNTQRDLIDPWGNPFVLEIPGRNGERFSIVSYGADGRPGGDGWDADIVRP